MKKVPITAFINKWLDADIKLAELCKSEDRDYHSDSAYRGYALGFEAGVNSQIVEETDTQLCVITKDDIIKAKKELTIADCSKYVSESDCLQLVGSSEEYWFLVGAVWALDRMRNYNK